MASENPRERFVRLAENRVTRTIRDIRLIGNLSNRNNYSYSDEDVRKILAALESEIRDLKRRFENRKAGAEIGFKL